MKIIQNKKRVLLVLLIAVIITIPSCSSIISLSDFKKAGENPHIQSDYEETNKINLKLWHIWVTDSDSNRQPFMKALSEWNRSNPNIRIDAEATENETYKIKIRTAIAVNEVPDIFYCWGAGFAKPFIDTGKVLSLNEYIDDATKEKLIPGTLEHFTYNNKIFGLPIFMIAGVFYCNKDLFDKNNIKIPNTYSELLLAVHAFREKNIIPITIGEKDGWPGIFYQNVLAIRTAGINLCNDALNKKASFNQEVFIKSAEKLVELNRVGAFDSRCMQITRDEAEADFKNGKAAMYYSGSWVAGSLERQDCPVKGKIIAKNFPILENEKGDANGFVGGAIDTFMISSSTKYKKEAVMVLKAIDEMFCRESYLSGAGIPAWKLKTEDRSVSPLASKITNLLKESDGFVLAWDTFLAGTDAQTHINLVADLFAGKRTPGEFAREMQRLNEKD